MSGETAPAKTSSKTADGLTADVGAVKHANVKNKRKKKATRKPSAKAAAKIIEDRIGYTFDDASLLATAFTHVSALKSARNRADSYQRLEFLGDHVLGLIVSDMLYRAFPKADEGELASRIGYKLPDNANDVLKGIDGAMLAKHAGPAVWSMTGGDAGYVTRLWIMQPLPAADAKPAK